MKKSNVRLGMKVQVKEGSGRVSAGRQVVVREIGDEGVFCTPLGSPLGARTYYYFNEVKRVKGHAYF